MMRNDNDNSSSNNIKEHVAVVLVGDVDDDDRSEFDVLFSMHDELFHPSVYRFAIRSMNIPIQNDAEYFDIMVACESPIQGCYNLTTSSRDGIYTSASNRYFGQPKSIFYQHGRDLKTSLMKLASRLNEKRMYILSTLHDHCEAEKEQYHLEEDKVIDDDKNNNDSKMVIKKRSLPLVESFLKVMDANEIECQIFRYFIVHVSGCLDSPDSSNSAGMFGDSGGFISATDVYQRWSTHISLIQFLTLTNIRSIWVKERIYERCDRISTSFNISAMSITTFHVFMGIPITTEKQYIDIESAKLQQTLLLYSDEFITSDVGRAVLQQHDVTTGGEGEDNNDSNDDGDIAINELANQLTDMNNGSKDGKGSGNIFRIIGEIQEKARDLELQQQQKEQQQKQEAEDQGVDENAISDVAIDDTDDPDEAVGIRNIGPYRNELDYLEDQFKLIDMEVRLQHLKDVPDDEFDDPNSPDDNYDYHLGMNKDEQKLQNAREADKLQVKVRRLRERVADRIRATKAERKVVPRLEQLCEVLKLQRFERFIVLSLIRATVNPKQNRHHMIGPSSQVEFFIGSYSRSLEAKMRCRRCFYKSSPLVQEGIITISGQDFSSDLNQCDVHLDRRLVDYICGVDLELSEIVNGSHLYTPEVSIDDVILPAEIKNRILDCALNYEAVKSKYRELEIEQKITYGLGQVILFYGSSGTGKTMMANAIATKLKRKILLINFPSLGLNEAGSIIKLLFREARIKKAIIFFDECESLFRSRDSGDSAINTCLTELERFDDMCILATNRAYDLDEAMFRRISLAVEFKKPDLILREKIWRTLKPEKLMIGNDVNFKELARKYELSGGFIKNVWLTAVSLMTSRNGDEVTQSDLERAAGEQVVGALRNEDLDRHVVPTCGIEAVVATDEVTNSLKDMVNHKKAQSVLFSQWGFDKIHRSKTGVTALFHGPPGTGKTLAAEAISFDIGCPLMVVNTAELMNKYVGQTGKNIVAVFRDAEQKGAVLVFDEGEGLFGSRSKGGNGGSSSADRHDNVNVGLLLQHIENFTGVCIVITNDKDSIDDAFFRRFHYVLKFELPGSPQREKLWKSIIPIDCPLSNDVSISILANRYELSGGNIKNAIIRAASRAALRINDDDHIVHMKDLEMACQHEINKHSNSMNHGRNMYV